MATVVQLFTKNDKAKKTYATKLHLNSFEREKCQRLFDVIYTNGNQLIKLSKIVETCLVVFKSPKLEP